VNSGVSSRFKRPVSLLPSLVQHQLGGTLLGFVIGLLVGLAIAVAVAVFITNAPLPFITKVQRPGANAVPSPGAALPDPNRSLYGTTKSEPSSAPSTVVAPPTAETPADKTHAKTEAPAEDGTRFLLQTGAFKSPDEADAMRARLALLGLDARIFPIEQGGQTLYRVRLGPYGQLAEINRTRKLLAENSIEAQVVRLK
jgi:cell division protein FtsN